MDQEQDSSQEEARDLKAVLRHGCSACRTTCKTTKVPDAAAGDGVIARTERGVEYALILTPAEEMSEGDSAPPVEVLRRASEEERLKQEEIDAEGRSEEYRFCQERIRVRELPMKLVRVEKIFGGGRMTFYFMADGRIDFRDLVRDLAREFRMRIELKQIGARDEAKILGDISYCGRELCCSSWIRDMKPVTMKMAKNQKSTLDPSKISGMCGRLLCCLRYEDEVYTELRGKLPKRGKRVLVKSTQMSGMVLHQEVLASTCVVLLDRGGAATVPGEDLELETQTERPETTS
ncbi:MAG: PSP1 domain-containing protein [Planctomycetota bacterium]|jgi:cell fate regulator YaaT (PSP1 superfamily)